MKISIFGLGYVGCVGMGCLAKAGHQVIGMDPQPQKVEFINHGKATIIENGIDELIADQRHAGNISATSSVADALQGTKVSFICVGTPSTPTGHLDLDAVFKVAGEIATALIGRKDKHVVALRSTVLPGTGERVAKLIEEVSGRKNGEDFAVVSNPEFLREGTSIEDFSNPPFTLVGSDFAWSTEIMRKVYAAINAEFIATTPRVAEIMKYACNSFHAVKITFANEVGNICKTLEIDAREVMRIFCMDTKLNVSKAYLKPGFAYGGSCLPKDLKALRTIAHDHYLDCPLLESVEQSNEKQKERVCDQIQRLRKQNVGFLGLSFKAGTDDLRESPIVDVVERLLGKGFSIRIYDPNVHVSQLTGANKNYILQKIPFIARFITDDLSSVIEGSDLIVVVNREAGVSEALARIAADKTIYDLADLGSD
ncbi:MAG: nucleotide sugar dehydrogenase, partial [Opitutaceae bacterium]